MNVTRRGAHRTRRALLSGVLATFVGAAGCVGSSDESSGHGLQAGQFEEVGRDVGLDYRVTDADTDMFGGVFVGDIDDSGRPDLLLTGGEQPVLYRNLGGEFERDESFPSVDAEIKSALFVDYDDDGREDLLLVPRTGQPVFLENDGGTFRRADVGLPVELSVGLGAAAADATGNGYPDLFVYQAGDWRDRVPARAQGGSLDDDNGNPNYLFFGDGSSFERADDAGIVGEHWSLAATFVDLTGDGGPDIHVANDFNRDVVYRNRGDGTFDRRELPNSNRHGMASTVADVTGDGTPELFVTNIEYESTRDVWEMQSGLGVTNKGNNLFVYEDGEFEDRAEEYGLRRGGWGWAASFADFANDGRQDVVHATKDYLTREDGESFEAVHTRPTVFERTDDGFDQRDPETLGFDHSSGRGLAVLDYDGDGRLDVLVADATGPFKLYRNAGAAGNWLAVEVEGTPEQTPLGATVSVTTSAGTQHRFLTSGAGFLSQASRTLHFGLGDADAADLAVTWPDGNEVTVEDVDAGQRLVVGYDGSTRTR